MAISRKIQSFISQSSWIRRMFEEGVRLRQIHGAENVFDFSLGNPNVDPPAVFKEELRRLAAVEIEGMHGYMPNAGYPDTRRAVADHLSGIHGVALTADHLVMTCGAGGALNVILKSLLDPGDEVVVPTPFFVEYRFYADNAGGVLKLVPTKPDFSLDLEALSGAISDKTKVVLINSPNNPTGRVYDDASIGALAKILAEKSRDLGRPIYLVSDEPYRELVYDGVKVPSILAAYGNSLVASSYSKNLSLPGERIGYIAVNPSAEPMEDLLGALVLCNRILGFVNAPALMQRVISRLQGVQVDAGIYQRKRDLLYEGLVNAGYDVTKPEGAFYLFPRSPIEDDVAFVRALQEKRILTVPGSGFGGPGHFRIAYCVDDRTILGALDGFAEVRRAYR
ncbi:MAG: aspartate aminotransferase [Deltaproteobacteria bacterium HGW-Deltaproteobacteria-19]|nr:MAG: aspartate aminotransferase [Deltaproteobacteria bacterium HGW-Deltaproteobacteria-19]